MLRFVRELPVDEGAGGVEILRGLEDRDRLGGHQQVVAVARETGLAGNRLAAHRLRAHRRGLQAKGRGDCDGSGCRTETRLPTVKRRGSTSAGTGAAREPALASARRTVDVTRRRSGAGDPGL